MNTTWEEPYYRQLLSTVNHSDTKVQNEALYSIFRQIVEELTDVDGIRFTTLFARISYAKIKYHLSGDLIYWTHYYRKNGVGSQTIPEEIAMLGLYVTTNFISKCTQSEVPDYLKSKIWESVPFPKSSPTITAFTKAMFGAMLSIDLQTQTFRFLRESDASEFTVQYNLADRNEMFTKSIEAFANAFALPVLVNLIDVQTDDKSSLRPAAFVFLPDFLFDISTLAECHSYSGPQLISHGLKKLLPFETSANLTLGNIVNFLLDQIISDPEISFDQLIQQIFYLYPIFFSRCSDAEVIDILKKAKGHFTNLQEVISNDFEKLSLNGEDAYIEPSFYSHTYGIQGRLDLFYYDDTNRKISTHIIELKSGKSYRPNAYGLNTNHYVQTLLYDLLIRSVYGHKTQNISYILYSAISENALRYAPQVKSKQFEALEVRNRLLLTEFSLENEENVRIFLEQLRPEVYDKAFGFIARDIQKFAKVYGSLDSLSKAYYQYFFAFIAREHHYAKTGEHGEFARNGQASLWRDDNQEKRARFEILEELEIAMLAANEEEPIISLARSINEENLSNFRIGDIVVLYPKSSKNKPALKHQIFKATIIEIQKTAVTIKLRSRQNNLSLFEDKKWWCIEPDFLDSSFNGMYRSLFDFAAAPLELRQVLLGVRPARKASGVTDLNLDYPMTEEQKSLLIKMIATPDYFLLWGPPGTGKTSYMLKYWVKYMFEQTSERILLLAYTNRAVDEICHAIESIAPEYENEYLRIGSGHGVSEIYRSKLLQNRIKACKSRKEILSHLRSKRIYVSTISSFSGKKEIMELVPFDRVLVDEASQVLEPMLIGILPKFKQWILVGDHKQLPAVVVQKVSRSQVKSEELKEVGFTNGRNSLFERLLLRNQEMGWDHTYGIISKQGRMHPSLMKFVNEKFYDNQLSALPKIPRLEKEVFLTNIDNPKDSFLSRRKVFISTPISDDYDVKINTAEAMQCVLLVEKIIDVYKGMRQDFSEKSVGIITPYRAQNALITRLLEDRELPVNLLTVDTVERYQGGARDIIIISFCVNHKRQLKSLRSLSDDGVDRKLNVALTRAKEQIFLIGNETLLKEEEIYSELLREYHKIDLPNP